MMRRHDSTALWLLALVLASAVGSREASASDEPGTLLQWGYGPTVRGGPDLAEPLVTDRPDFTESAVTVGMGVVQIEAGYTYTYDESENGSFHENSFPETLIRIGILAQWLEMRVGFNYGASAETVFTGSDEMLSGAEDLYLGTKLALTPQSGVFPETGVILQMTVPSGSNDLTANEVLPGINYLYAWDITERFSIAGSSQINRSLDDDAEDFYVEFAQSITSGYAVTETVGMYAEWFMFAPTGADSGGSQQYFDTGLTWQITDNIQWDIRVGAGLNDAADDLFAGSGISIRIP